jgi:hypothetical protein
LSWFHLRPVAHGADFVFVEPQAWPFSVTKITSSLPVVMRAHLN